MNLVSTSTNIPLFIDVLVDVCARSTPSPVHEHLVVLVSMLAIACKGEMFTYLRAKLFCDHFHVHHQITAPYGITLHENSLPYLLDSFLRLLSPGGLQ